MSQPLVPLNFPLKGSRLIEASAGTGKTWTIAALYVRLVLGHGNEHCFGRPLNPSEILVMTFTRAATRELSDRIRARLVEAAAYFRGNRQNGDNPFLQALIEGYPSEQERLGAAHRLMMAAEAMDECAIFTIDAWCQRMLREHAFDSGCLFDEELVSSEASLFKDAVRDYWRQQVYALDVHALSTALGCWGTVEELETSVRRLISHATLCGTAGDESLGQVITRVTSEQKAHVATLKPGWSERTDRMEAWIALHRGGLNGNKLRAATVANCFKALRAWATDETLTLPGEGFDKGWEKLLPENIVAACNRGYVLNVPDDFCQLALLCQALATIEPIRFSLMRHAAVCVTQRMAELKRRMRQFGFADMLSRLRAALEGGNGATLARRITAQYPVALVDEFQDTSPDQYRIFDLLYRVSDENSCHGLFLIGDPKQAIYGFRGADIRSYLEARQATAGRHYVLGTNFRSAQSLVQAVNQLFLHAEGHGAHSGHPHGAFRYRNSDGNPLPFDSVLANGRKEILMNGDGELIHLTLWCNQGGELKVDEYRAHFAGMCAEKIVGLLNDANVGFDSAGKFERLIPADIAVLVRDRTEAAAVRRALQQRKVSSVYLSDKDSVFNTEEAGDVLLWLQAVVNPLNNGGARAAFATRTAGLSLPTLAMLALDDATWEARVEQLKALRLVWQRQGVLAMLRRFIHELGLPATLLKAPSGERTLTNLLHLAELLQSASQQLDGEQALIRWLAEQIHDDAESGDETILRLESDADLVKVITVHKSKGLEFPLVFLPFGVSAKPVDRRNRSFFMFVAENGERRIDFSLSEQAREAMEAERLEEDVRLLYVALTRARHALWIGVTSLNNKIHESAFGYLLAGGAPVACSDLLAKVKSMCGDCSSIRVEEADESPALTVLTRQDTKPRLVDAPEFDASFEKNWSIASYTSLTRDLGSMPAPTTPLAEKLMADDDAPAVGKTHDAPWHRFPRGAIPGQFLHEQLEWMGNEGFGIVHGETFEHRLRARCDRAGWGVHQDDVVAWMQEIVTTSLPPTGAPLCAVKSVVPEMEFWFPAEHLATGEVDALCQAYLLDGLTRPALSERQVHGMLRGFKDLVFEYEGRYWVLDYKSNGLGPSDASYHKQALAEGMASCRYDAQGMIYLVALHRLLKSRLGQAYDPTAHLGGAIFFFLRGVAHPDTHGCYLLPAHPALLEKLDQLLPMAIPLEDIV